MIRSHWAEMDNMVARSRVSFHGSLRPLRCAPWKIWCATGIGISAIETFVADAKPEQREVRWINSLAVNGEVVIYVDSCAEVSTAPPEFAKSTPMETTNDRVELRSAAGA